MVAPPAPYTPFLKRERTTGGGDDKIYFAEYRVRGGGQMEEKSENAREFEKILRGKKAKLMRKSLMEQLVRAGNDTDYYIDLVDDYMDMYATKQLLVNDNKDRGVRVAYDNGGGQKGFKKNDSVEQRLKVNAQMLKLLTELNITPSEDEGGDGDDEL